MLAIVWRKLTSTSIRELPKAALPSGEAFHSSMVFQLYILEDLLRLLWKLSAQTEFLDEHESPELPVSYEKRSSVQWSVQFYILADLLHLFSR